MTVVVTAVFYPRPGRKQELAEAMRRGIEAVHTEDGCELYAIHDAEDGTLTMIEKWSSAEALDTHGDSDQVTILRADVAELVEKPALVTRMTPLPRGTQKQGQL
ncbi:antibiotic biosynthesis monooxygenase [Brachybacterium vulturis]|uniref:Antibiotic biosynthesis monooxygenase n=1 Tax=Brachybacterium vulturis TaxID=2017484 RepID=A0A291GRV5_9MICO|nr:putative quinol monooxygenase [Brachybacterium vulturis]ATG52850.1 antibiotic biosynthesis monooxygenase [Brachybacterium vulturis]